MSRFGMHSYCRKFQYTEPYTKCTLSNLPAGITSTASHSSTTVSPSKNANTSKRELMNQLEKVGIQVYIHNMNLCLYRYKGDLNVPAAATTARVTFAS